METDEAPDSQPYRGRIKIFWNPATGKAHISSEVSIWKEVVVVTNLYTSNILQGNLAGSLFDFLRWMSSVTGYTVYLETVNVFGECPCLLEPEVDDEDFDIVVVHSHRCRRHRFFRPASTRFNN